VSGSCWKNCACTWRGAGSPVGVRAGDSPSLDVLEEPAWPLSGVEPVSGVVERIVEQCIAAGLVEGEQMSVDSSFHHGEREPPQVVSPANSSRRQRK